MPSLVTSTNKALLGMVARLPWGRRDMSGSIDRKHGVYVEYVSLKPGFHHTANATTTTQKQNDYKVEQSSFTLIALF